MRRLTPLPLLVTMIVLAFALTMLGYAAHVQISRLIPAILNPDPDVFGEMYFHFSLLPRVLVAFLAGAGLGLAGLVFQQVLKNSLAEPATLGLLSGAQLAITIASLFSSALTLWQREAAGLVGAFAALFLVGMLASRRGFSPVAMLLSGMVISFFAGAASVVLALFNHEYLRAIFIWASGSLVQNDFTVAKSLLFQLIVCLPPMAFLVRPLTLAGLDETAARSLGLPIKTVRLIALSLASIISAIIVANVGVIAFIGLAAPHIASLAGARSFARRLFWAPLLGGVLLLLADGLVLSLSRFMGEVPTGTVTALSGALLLLFMLKHLQVMTAPANAQPSLSRSTHPQYRVLCACVLLLAVIVLFSLTEQIFIQDLALSDLMPDRWPRILASISAGTMLALAGATIQAVTGNALASPEGLGVSAGASLGIVAVLFGTGSFFPPLLLLGGCAGALLTFLVIMLIARSAAYAPGPVLLAGVAIGTFAAALISLILASGDPRAVYVLALTMGPTFRATALTGLVAAAIALLSLPIVLSFIRWFEILPLGDTAMRTLGLSPVRARTVLLSLAALMTAAATLVVGPLSFVGLMAPHIAAAIAPGRPLPRVLCAGLIGAILMAAADWLGRSVDFPYEIPAGVLAAFIGGPYFLWLLYQRSV